MEDTPVPLLGGAQTPVVRIGGTVRRPRHARSDEVQALLQHLHDVGFTGAPRPLGTDEQDRDVVEHVEGVVPSSPPFLLSDARLTSAARLVRAYHDASASLPGLRTGQVVCHGDLGPHNTVFRGDEAVALIDWDADVAPGPRLVDVAHAAWCFADLVEDAVAVPEQARRLRVFCSAYGDVTPGQVVDELTARFARAQAQHAAAGRTAAAEVFDRLSAQLADSRAVLVASA